jgi:hypothetical protein
MTSGIKDNIFSALEKDETWLERYNTTNELHVNSITLKELPDICDSVDLDNVRKVTDIVTEVGSVLTSLTYHDNIISEPSKQCANTFGSMERGYCPSRSAIQKCKHG